MEKQWIESGKTALGIEFGSTRIKAVLIGPDHQPLASGSHTWENQLVDGIWTYSQEMIINGLQDCYRDLKADVQKKFGTRLTTFGGIGISAMMHGYLPFDKDMQLLVPFRTWRNTMTAQAAEKLTKLFQFNIPQRWSLAHLYQAILNQEEHVPHIRHFTTLAGYVHLLLTGEKVLGIGDASGMMPIDSATGSYDTAMIQKFDDLIQEHAYPWKLHEILPRVLPAGAVAGKLTAKGAALLDPEGDLQPGIPLCPPEGDAGTGMTATNSVAVRTGNVSAGTSVFAMIVLEKPLSKVYPEIDMVTTPTGKPVAMVHCNSCTSDLNAWVQLLSEFGQALGAKVDMNEVYTLLFNKAMEGDKDGGGLVSFNYYGGEPITGAEEGRPLFTRLPDAPLTLANFMRTQLYAAMATLKIGMEILANEKVAIDSVLGHGGFFKTKGVGQSILAAAINSPVTVMSTAGEGGAWGMALLTDYMMNHADNENLEAYLTDKVFSGMEAETLAPDPADVAGFDRYIERYRACLDAEKAAAAALH